MRSRTQVFLEGLSEGHVQMQNMDCNVCDKMLLTHEGSQRTTRWSRMMWTTLKRKGRHSWSARKTLREATTSASRSPTRNRSKPTPAASPPRCAPRTTAENAKGRKWKTGSKRCLSHPSLLKGQFCVYNVGSSKWAMFCLSSSEMLPLLSLFVSIKP